jgi:glycosyltransferase involved in cell wall biosynthesis
MLEPYNKAAAADCREGYEELAKLADKVDYCIADSEYNKQDLIKAGYKCKIDVLPILIAFSDYDKKPDAPLYGKYNDGVTNIIFTGRIASNKCQQDVIHAFGLYQKYYNSNSRLILVGNEGGYETYKLKMQKYAQLNCIKNVIFTGHIRFAEILACYKAADLFLCMSEHEGFCVPLVEAMYFKIPVIAYNSSAVGETLGKGGILLNEKNALETAALMDKILKDKGLQKKIIANQNERLDDFAHDKILARFNELLRENVL